ncbi:MAG: hypothetical protein U0M02_06740 [Acutalibacteraceae bacterium]|nr:hypothetical protein [Acutalibacteraceae bacterium]
MKKLAAILIVFAMLFSFAACKDNGENEGMTNPYATDANGETVTDEQGENITVINEESTTEAVSETEDATAVTEITMPSEDPSTWTKEQIVEYYKSAAINSKSKKSVEKKNLVEMVVNDGDGLLAALVKMVTPILVSALEDSQTEFDGITGGYENLVPDDVQSAKAYRSGEYVVVEMKMKEQIDGAHGDRYGGTVGHAISVVGDLAVVEEALPQLEMGFDEAKFVLHYKNPELKVKINKDGVIEKGTWTYIIDIDVENLYVGGKRLPLSATVKSAYGTVDYVITVGGGF